MSEQKVPDGSYCLHAIGIGRTGAGYADGLLRTGEIEDILEDPRARLAITVIDTPQEDQSAFSAQPTRVQDYAKGFYERLRTRNIPEDRFSFESVAATSIADAESAISTAAKVVNEGELPARVMVCFNAAGQAGAGMAEECAEQLNNQLTSADVLGVMQLPHSGDADRSSGLRSTAERFFDSTAFNGGMIIVNTEHSWQRLTAYTDRNNDGSFPEIGTPAVRDRFRQDVTNKFSQDAFMRFAVAHHGTSLTQALNDSQDWTYYNLAKFTHPGVQVLPGEALSKWHDVIDEWIDHLDDYSLLNQDFRSPAITVHTHSPRLIGFNRLDSKLEAKLRANFLKESGQLHEFENHEFFDHLTAYADIMLAGVKPSDLTLSN
tara:strand:+ start:2678 stop:3805 length:1128 start_codon:yes stop_codon:yes gene_type:complete